MINIDYIKSPMNYVGGKYKLLPQIIPLFPKKINTLVDLFCGGLDIALNVNADHIIANDIIKPMIELYGELQKYDSDKIVSHIENNIIKYELSKQNKHGYLQLRECYNQNKNSFDLMTLIAYCYNNQIRFNSKWGFNRAFGENRSEFNPSMKENLIKTINRIHISNIKFTNQDCFEFDLSNLDKDDFVYVDPPYLITNADYSVQAQWNDKKEEQLLNILDELNKKNIKFALSNVIEHDGKVNYILKDWSKTYNINYLNFTYKNANADKKVKNGKSAEVLITNYETI